MTVSGTQPDSPVEQDASFPPEGSTVERRNPASGTSGGVGSTQAVSGDLRAALASIVHAAACQCADAPTGVTLRSLDVNLIADAVLAAGYRPVVADDATVERVARAMHDVDCGCGDEDTSYVEMARAAVQALRDEGNDA